MKRREERHFSIRKLDILRFGFFGMTVMALTFFMTTVFTSEIPSLAEETFFVNSADDVDDGSCDAAHCSLREAINDANLKVNGSGIDRIYFEIPEDALKTIELTKPLPTITDPVVIDATTNPGYQGSPMIELSGNGSQLDGFVVTAGETHIKGFIISHFRGNGIYVTGYGGNRVQGNMLCTNGTTTDSFANNVGIFIDSSSGNVIGGPTPSEKNVIAGCSGAGIVIQGEQAKQNVVIGNDIGLGAGTPMPVGILIDGAQGNTIGGLAATEGNRISARGTDPIVLTGGAEEGNDVSHNSIIE